MAHMKNNKPKFKDKEGNMHIQIFINKGKDGVKYPIFKVWRYRFPFKYNASIDFYATEVMKLKELLNRMPHIEIKQTQSYITKKGKGEKKK
tara:strand:- start:1598 stop:1870 length:273 start_codon:yes stop_codon:yes gene_type:complete